MRSGSSPDDLILRPGPDPVFGDVAQLGEHRLCKAGVEGSSPSFSIPAQQTEFSTQPLARQFGGLFE